MYQVIYADPPWRQMAGCPFGKGGKSKELPYPTMSLEDIKALPIRAIAAPDSHLYLWTTNHYLEDAYDVARGWGYRPSTMLVWCKAPRGLGLGGAYVPTCEYLLFARRGHLAPLRRMDTTWWCAKRGKHSVKPELFRQIIDSVSPGRKIELFARRKDAAGWDFWGNEIDSDISFDTYIPA